MHNHLMHEVRTNYRTCSAKSSENICSTSRRRLEKGKDRMKLSFSQLAVEALRKRERQDETQFFSISGGGA